MNAPLATLLIMLPSYVIAALIGWWLAVWDDKRETRRLQRLYPGATHGPAQHRGATVAWADRLRELREKGR